MKIAHVDPEEHLPDCSQDGIAYVSVQKGHCALMYRTLEPIADTDIFSPAEFLDQGHGLIKMVAIVAVADQDIRTPGVFDPALKRGAVSPHRALHYPGAQLPRDFSAAVNRTIIGNKDLAVNVIVREKLLGPFDAEPLRFRFVLARHENGKFFHCNPINAGPPGYENDPACQLTFYFSASAYVKPLSV